MGVDQYRCAISILILSCTYNSINVIIGRDCYYPGHGRDVVDGLYDFDKVFNW